MKTPAWVFTSLGYYWWGRHAPRQKWLTKIFPGRYIMRQMATGWRLEGWFEKMEEGGITHTSATTVFHRKRGSCLNRKKEDVVLLKKTMGPYCLNRFYHLNRGFGQNYPHDDFPWMDKMHSYPEYRLEISERIAILLWFYRPCRYYFPVTIDY